MYVLIEVYISGRPWPTAISILIRHCIVSYSFMFVFQTGDTIVSVNIIEFKCILARRNMLDTKSYIPNYIFESDFS